MITRFFRQARPQFDLRNDRVLFIFVVINKIAQSIISIPLSNAIRFAILYKSFIPLQSRNVLQRENHDDGIKYPLPA
jgi:hypothetical protein